MCEEDLELHCDTCYRVIKADGTIDDSLRLDEIENT